MKAHKHQRKEIKNISQLLIDIKRGQKSRELTKKYKKSRPTLNKRIKEILEKYGVTNFKEAKIFLKNKSNKDNMKLEQ